MAFDLSKRPEHVSGNTALTTAAISGMGGGAPAHISIKGNRFTLVDAGGTTIVKSEQTYIDTILLNVNPNVSKIYYPDNYDPDDVKPPTCWSDNGIGPSTECNEPQNITCQGCEFNRWGSAISALGSKVKACRDYKKVAVFTNLKRDMQFLLSIPPNSFPNWKAYCGMLGANGVNLCDVITRISFEEDVLGTLVFEAVGWMPEKFKAVYDQWLETGKLDNLIGVNDKPIDGKPVAKPAANAGQKTLPPPVATNGAGKPAGAPQSKQATMKVQEEITPPAAKSAARKPGRPPAAKTPVGEDEGVPEFLRRTSPGMEEAPEPDDEMAKALDEAFAV